MKKTYNVDINADVSRALIEDLHSTPSDLAKVNGASKQCLSTLATLAKQDITAQLIPEHEVAEAHIITREDIVLCGKAWAQTAFTLIDSNIKLTWHYEDSDKIEAGQSLVDIKGYARSILTSERTALNFLQTLSATATSTANYAKHLQGFQTQLLDTRKTLPGFRQAQKYAVTCGGGANHRMGLYDAFLIKENHIKACGTITNAIKTAKEMLYNKPIEVEVESLDELNEAIKAGADIIMLDNFSTEQVQRAVALNNQQCKLEVSGNITEERLAELAKTNVDFVSTGAITKHVKAVDLSLLIL